MEQWINELTFNSDINLQQLVSFSDNLKTQVSSSFAPGICPSPMNRKYIFVLYSIELYLFTHIVMYGVVASMFAASSHDSLSMIRTLHYVRYL